MASEPRNVTGRTKPAQAPVARAPLGTRTAPKAPKSAPDAAAAPAGPTAEPPTAIPAPVGAAPGSSAPAAFGPVTDEERVLITLVRHLDTIGSLRTLSPVEQALVAGAKINFERLAELCDAMLSRKPSDLVAGPPSPPPSLPPTEPTSTSGTVAAAPQHPEDTRGGKGALPAEEQPAGAAGSLMERLAMLESRLDHCTRLIGEVARTRLG
jgi:hypothetical protein